MRQPRTDARRRHVRRRWRGAALIAVVLSVAVAPATASAGGQVLVFTGNAAISEANFTNFASHAGRSLVVEPTTLPADLSQNSCVLLPVNQTRFDGSQTASLRAYVNAGGTVVAMGENGHFAQGPPGNHTMNALAASLGVAISIDPNGREDAGFRLTQRIGVSPYTAGVTTLAYAYTSYLSVESPASVLVSTLTYGSPFVAVQQVGAGKVVMSADSNVFSDELGGYVPQTDNGRFARNLCGDITPPAVTIVTPPEGARYKKDQVVDADWFCTEPTSDSGVDLDPLKTFGTKPSGQPIDTSVASGTSVTKTFRATCTDNLGNSAFKEHRYVVDDRPPTITITAPDGGPYARGSAVPASWSCTDPDDDIATKAYANGPLSGTVSGQAIDTSTEGLKSFTVTCTDLAGNSATPQTVQYTVANSPPVATITSPLNGARFKAGTPVNAAWGCSDPDGPLDLVTQTSEPAVASGSPIDTTTPGPHSFKVTCKDEGPPVTKTHSYFVDASPPVATIAVPLDGGVYERRAVVPASWTCTDPDSDIDPNPAKTFGTMPVGQPIDTVGVGTKSFSVTCTDSVGNASPPKTVQYTVIDASPPVVTITVPKDGATYAQGQVVAPSYACTDPDGITDIKSCLREGGATGPVDTSKPGKDIEFRVNGEDLAGNKATAVVRYSVTAKGATPGAQVSPSGKPSAPAKACKSRRQFRIRVKKLRGGVSAVSATVFVNGKKTLTRKGRRVTAIVTLKGLKKGRYKVRINVRYSNGRVLTYTRKFKTCTPKGR